VKTHNVDRPGAKASRAWVGTATRSRAGGQLRWRDEQGNDYAAGSVLAPNITQLPDDEVVLGPGSSLVKHFDNNALVDLALGDVVVIENGAVITTTTPQDTRPVGVVQVDTAAGDQAPVILVGYAPQINTTASVTSGNYAETSSTAGQANESATRRIGSFAQFLSTGTNPDGYLFGVTDSSGAAATAGDGMVPYYIEVDDTFAVPLYRQALFSEPIEVDGALVVNGILQGVD
jgi:hypothetical protein